MLRCLRQAHGGMGNHAHHVNSIPYLPWTTGSAPVRLANPRDLWGDADAAFLDRWQAVSLLLCLVPVPPRAPRRAYQLVHSQVLTGPLSARRERCWANLVSEGSMKTSPCMPTSARRSSATKPDSLNDAISLCMYPGIVVMLPWHCFTAQ